MRRALAVAAVCGWAFAAVAGAHEVRVVAGRDRAWVVPPAGSVVADYENAGYRLRRNGDGTATVEVELAPLGSTAPFLPPRTPARSSVEKLAHAVAAGARDRYDAVARLLAWESAHIAYQLDRAAGQGAEEVLVRRSAYCTGAARLAVALLAAVGIEAREVPGFVVESVPGGPTAGFHRWIEVYFPDRGWVYSDPLVSHGFVAATYLRLADDRVTDPPGTGRLVEREADVREIDLLAWPAPPGGPVRVRPNQDGRRAAALAIRLEPALDGEATLDGGGTRRRLELAGGRGAFLGLEPGEYQLRVEAGGRLAAWKRLTFRNRVLAQLELPLAPALPSAGEGASR